MFNNGAKVLAYINNVGPKGEHHTVEITSVNSDGTFDYYNAIAEKYVYSSSADVGYMFSIQCP